MNYLRLLTLWLHVERRTRTVRCTQDATGHRRLSLALPARSAGNRSGSAALTWTPSDPLAVRVSYLDGTVCLDRVVARDALRITRGSQLDLAFGDGRPTIRVPGGRVRRFLRATDSVVPRAAESRLVAHAADAFLAEIVRS